MPRNSKQAKSEESYAVVLHRMLKDVEMAPLQGIYDYFREDTNMLNGRSEDGMQNSIRHNLSQKVVSRFVLQIFISNTNRHSRVFLKSCPEL